MARKFLSAEALTATGRSVFFVVFAVLLRSCSARGSQQVPLAAADGGGREARDRDAVATPLKRVFFRQEERSREKERPQQNNYEQQELMRVLGRPVLFEQASRTTASPAGAPSNSDVTQAQKTAKAVNLEDVLTMEDHLVNHPQRSEAAPAEGFKTTSLEIFASDRDRETSTPQPVRCLPPKASLAMSFFAINLQPYLDCLGAYCDDAEAEFLDQLLGKDQAPKDEDGATTSLGGCRGILKRSSRSCSFDLSLAYPVPDGTLLGFLCGSSCPDMCVHEKFYQQRLLSRGSEPLRAAKELLLDRAQA